MYHSPVWPLAENGQQPDRQAPQAVEVPRKLQRGSCCCTRLIQSKGVQPETCNQYCWRMPSRSLTPAAFRDHPLWPRWYGL